MSEIILDAGYAIQRGPSVDISYERALALGMLTPFQSQVVGPRLVGGVYRSSYWHEDYEVTQVMCGFSYVSRKYVGREPVIELEGGGVEISVRWMKSGRTSRHCTSWDLDHDKVISQPPLPQRVRLINRKRVFQFRRVMFTGNHACSLCMPGIIGRMERQIRTGALDYAQFTRDVELISMHHRAIMGEPRVTLDKSGSHA